MVQGEHFFGPMTPKSIIRNTEHGTTLVRGRYGEGLVGLFSKKCMTGSRDLKFTFDHNVGLCQGYEFPSVNGMKEDHDLLHPH